MTAHQNVPMVDEGLGELLHLVWCITDALDKVDQPIAMAFAAAATAEKSVMPPKPELDFDFPFPGFGNLHDDLGS